MPSDRSLLARQLLLLLLLLVSGLLLTGGAIWADQHFVDDPLRACHDSAGVPLLGLVAAWAGLVGGLTAAGWLTWSAARGGSRAWVGPVSVALLVLSVLPLVIQGIAVYAAVQDSGPRPSPCFGLAEFRR